MQRQLKNVPVISSPSRRNHRNLKYEVQEACVLRPRSYQTNSTLTQRSYRTHLYRMYRYVWEGTHERSMRGNDRVVATQQWSANLHQPTHEEESKIRSSL